MIVVVMSARHVSPVVQSPVELVPMLVVAQHGWPIPPQAMQVPVDSWAEQYVLGAVQT